MSDYRLIRSEMKNKVNFQLWHEPESYRWRINVIESVTGNGLSVNQDRVSYLDDLDDMDISISRSTALNYDSVYTYHCPTRLVRLQVA